MAGLFQALWLEMGCYLETRCDKGVVEKGGLVIRCLGWRERKSKESKNDTNGINKS